MGNLYSRLNWEARKVFWQAPSYWTVTAGYFSAMGEVAVSAEAWA